jgi:hypothetical protein
VVLVGDDEFQLKEERRPRPAADMNPG